MTTLKMMFSVLMVFTLSTLSVFAQLFQTDERTFSLDRQFYVREAGCSTRDVVCGSLSSSQRNVLVIGDSFAIDAYNAFVSAYPNINFILLGSNGCAPFDELGTGKEKCDEENAARNAALAELISVEDVILTLSLMPDDHVRRAELPNYIRELSAAGRRVIVMGGAVRYKRPLPELYARFASASQPLPDLSEFLDHSPTDLDFTLEQVMAETGGVFIDRNAFICPGGNCRSYTLAEDALLYMDGRHSTLTTSRELGAYIFENYPGLFN